MKNLGRYNNDLSVPRKQDVDGKYTKPADGIPKSDLDDDVQSSLNKADSAQTAADNAQSTADTARSTANSAKAIAQIAQSTADKAKSTADNAQSTANAAATKANPVFTGSFSQNRKADSTIGSLSHAEGYGTTASGNYSHAEGGGTTASGYCSHAEGSGTTASDYCSHAEGDSTTASGNYSHAEGSGTTAIGVCSHAEGGGTTAIDNYSHAEGKYNIPDASRAYAHIVGNGLSNEKQSNAHTLDWSGNAWFAGDVYVGSTSGTNKDDGSKKLATQEYADGKALGMDITGASAGQIIKIKSVDANGKPTEWESVDIVNLLPIYDGGVS